MHKREGLRLTGAILFFGLVFWAGARMRNTSPSAHQALNTTEETMTLSQHNPSTSATIPPIDAAAPEKFETATFGLG